jgi:hypothetical protein
MVRIISYTPHTPYTGATRTRGKLFKVFLTLGLTALFTIYPNAHAAENKITYDQLYPHYVEACYVTQVNFKSGFSGNQFGHAAMFLKGACRIKDAPYPQIRLCDPQEAAGTDEGVGISVDSDFANANWIAVDGKDYFLRGGVAETEPFDDARADAVVEEAVNRGYFHGVRLNAAAQEREGRSDEYWVALQGLSTDYGLTLGRDAYCMKIPVTPSILGKIVDYLNHRNLDANAHGSPYKIIGNNCADVIYDALAAAGIWNGKDINASLYRDIMANQRAVPGTLLADLARASDGDALPAPERLVTDPFTLNLLESERWMMRQPGVLEEGFRLHEYQNAIFKNLHVFRADPLDLFGSDMRALRRLVSEPERSDIVLNLESYRNRYQSQLESLQRTDDSTNSAAIQGYADYLSLQLDAINDKLRSLKLSPTTRE